MTDAVGLPESWTRATVGELVDGLQYGFTASAEPDAGGPRFLRITDIENGRVDWTRVPGCTVSLEELAKYRLEHGDMVFARTGSIEKACAVQHPPEAVFASYLIRGRPSLPALSPWLHHFVLSSAYVEQAKLLSAGIGRPNVNARSLSGIKLPVAPLSEQQRIVEAIESYLTRLDNAVALLKRVEENLKRYRASVLKAAVEGRLVPTEAELARREGRSYEPASELLKRILAERKTRWIEDAAEKARAKAEEKARKAGQPWTAADDAAALEKERAKTAKQYKTPAAPDLSALRAHAGTTDLPELPEGWRWVSVEQLATVVADGVHKKPDYVPDGIPFVTVRNLTAGPGISFERLNYVTEEDHLAFSQRTRVEKGDLLISKDGTLGVVRAVRTSAQFSIFVSVALVKPALQGMTDYLEVAFSSPPVQAQMVPKGSGLQHIHLEDLRADCVPVPPLQEQQRIASACATVLSIVANLETARETALCRCAQLRQSILKWAFEGKLVEQDPSDEPASVLLKRIEAVRATAGAPKARGGKKRSAN